jgi:hypothetical protein
VERTATILAAASIKEGAKEGAMNQPQRRDDRSTSDRLHPAVYVALIGAVLLFAIAVWSFAVDRYTDYLLVIVSGFALIAVGIPLILSRVGRDESASRETADSSFREWAQRDFETWQDRVRGANAAIEILLPISAIAIGMLAIGIVLHLSVHGGA